MSDNIDLNTPPTKREVDEWLGNLSPGDQEEVRRRQLEHAAVTRQQDKAPDFGSMSDGELEAYKRRHGFYSR